VTPAAARAATPNAATRPRDRVPTLISRASAAGVNPAVSSGSSTIAGDAPAARSTFAVNPATTMFV